MALQGSCSMDSLHYHDDGTTKGLLLHLAFTTWSQPGRDVTWGRRLPSFVHTLETTRILVSYFGLIRRRRYHHHTVVKRAYAHDPGSDG